MPGHQLVPAALAVAVDPVRYRHDDTGENPRVDVDRIAVAA